MSWLKQVIILLTITAAGLAFLIHTAPLQADVLTVNGEDYYVYPVQGGDDVASAVCRGAMGFYGHRVNLGTLKSTGVGPDYGPNDHTSKHLMNGEFSTTPVVVTAECIVYRSLYEENLQGYAWLVSDTNPKLDLFEWTHVPKNEKDGTPSSIVLEVTK